MVGERKLQDLQFVRVILVRSFFPSVNGVIFFIFKQQDSAKWDAVKRIQMLINSRLANFVLTGLRESLQMTLNQINWLPFLFFPLFLWEFLFASGVLYYKTLNQINHNEKGSVKNIG